MVGTHEGRGALEQALHLRDLHAIARREQECGWFQAVLFDDTARRRQHVLKDTADQAALFSVQVGDALVRAYTTKWQAHDGQCERGEGVETLEHHWWTAHGTRR